MDLGWVDLLLFPVASGSRQSASTAKDVEALARPVIALLGRRPILAPFIVVVRSGCDTHGTLFLYLELDLVDLLFEHLVFLQQLVVLDLGFFERGCQLVDLPLVLVLHKHNICFLLLDVVLMRHTILHDLHIFFLQ